MVGTYQCTCDTGFLLSRNGRTCEGTPFNLDNKLLTAFIMKRTIDSISTTFDLKVHIGSYIIINITLYVLYRDW